MDRATWLDQRRRGVGSSDAAALCGVCPYKTALHVYLAKVRSGPPDQEEDPGLDYRMIGNVIEPAIARMYVQETGKDLVKPPAIAAHPKLSWMIASVDYQHKDDGEPVDCKNVGVMQRKQWGAKGSDQAPAHYVLQMQHQMEVLDKDKAHLAVLFGGNDFAVYTIHRDYLIAGKLVEVGHQFWEMVEARRPPEPDFAHPHAEKVLRMLYAAVEKRVVTLGDEELARVKNLFERQEQAKLLAAEIQREKAILLSRMGNADLAELPEGYTLTRKLVKRKEVVIPASQYVDFRPHKPARSKVLQTKTTPTPATDDAQAILNEIQPMPFPAP